MPTDSVALPYRHPERSEGSIIDSGEHARWHCPYAHVPFCLKFCGFPLLLIDPSTSLRMTAWGTAEAVGVLRATAEYAPLAHFYPVLTRDPSPRVYSRKACITNGFNPR